LAIASNDKVYLGTHFKGTQDGHIYVHDPETATIDLFKQFMIPSRIFQGQQIVDLGVPFPSEGIYSLAALPLSEYLGNKTLLCGITTPSGFLFIFDISKRSVIYKRQVAGKYLPRSLVVTPEGCIYGSGTHGQLFRFTLNGFELQFMDLWLPASKGREYLNTIDAVVNCKDGLIYGGAQADGLLFKFDPCSEQIISLGKPPRGGRIRALTETRSGTLLGVSGDDGMVSRLFRYDPSTGDLSDLGMLRATLPDEWLGHEFDAILTGPNGEIYLGESDRISRLFTYFPPYESSTASNQ
jgi:hypothetical protein